MHYPTRPYWLALATPGTLVHGGVCVREDWEVELADIFARANAQLGMSEPLVSGWQFRCAHQPSMSALAFCNSAPFSGFIEASSPARAQAASLDASTAHDDNPESWQISYVYRDRRTSCGAIHSARLRAPRSQAVAVQKFFMAFTSASMKAVDLLDNTHSCYGWTITRQMEDPFLSPQDIMPAFRMQLEMLSRGAKKPLSEDQWSKLRAMDAEMQALLLRSNAPVSTAPSGTSRL